MLIVDAQGVRDLLPMAECLDALDLAMRETSAGRVAIPPRTIAPLADQSGYLGVMPGSALDPKVYGAKVISLHPDNPKRHGLPAIQGFVALFDHDTGTPLALIEGGELTAVRTAAASGLATRELAREDASSLGILGCGVQARTHLEAVSCVRDLREVLVWGRDKDKAHAFVEQQLASPPSALVGRLGESVSLRVAESAQEACGCCVVCTVTGSPEPVLFGNWLEPGSHINLVGAHTRATREADGEAIGRSRIYVDLLESARREAGDLELAFEEGLASRDQVIGEIGSVLLGDVPGRQDSSEITLYKSLGIVAQDLATAYRVYERARRRSDLLD